MRIDAIIEYTHRFVAVLTSPVIFAAAIVSWQRTRSVRWVSRPLLIAIVFLLAVVVFGAFAVLTGLLPGVAALDLGSALMVLALVLTTTVVAFARRSDPTLPDRISFRSSFAKLTLWALVAVFLLLVSGVLVASGGSGVRCLGGPLYGGPLLPVDFRTWLQLLRLFAAGVASLLILLVVVQAWRMQRRRVAVLRVATALGIVFLIYIIFGALIVAGDPPISLLVISVATTAALWALLVVLVVLAGLPYPSPTGGDLGES
jgi:heme A synthase